MRWLLIQAVPFRLGGCRHSPRHLCYLGAPLVQCGGAACDTADGAVGSQVKRPSAPSALLLRLLPIGKRCRKPLARQPLSQSSPWTEKRWGVPCRRQNAVHVSTANRSRFYGQLKALSELILCLLAAHVYFVSKSSLDGYWIKALLHSLHTF